MFEYLESLYNDFITWMTGLWENFVEFLEYLPVQLLDLLLSAFAALIEAIPVPDFVQNNGLQTAINSLSPDIIYFLSMSGLDNAMFVLSAGFAFRLLRKFVTLFQW